MQLQEINTKKNRSFFYALFLLVTAVMIWLVWGYISTVFLSILTVIVFRPLYLWILQILRGRSYLATSLTILLVFLMVLIPVASIVLLVIGQIATFIGDLAAYFRGTDISLEYLVDLVNTIVNNVPFLGLEYAVSED